MGLEAVTFISDLVSTNPTAGDYVSAGDDHIRRIKTALLNTFPSITGAVTATHAELNKLAGVTATAAELNKLAGLIATTAELNKLAGVTATTAQINKLANLPLPVADGGTGRSTLASAVQDFLKSVGNAEGDMLYHNGTDWVALPKGTALQQLRRNAANSAPEWATIPSGSLLGIFGKFTSGTVTAVRPAGATKALIRVQGGGGAGVTGFGGTFGGGSGAFAEAFRAVSGDLTVTVGGAAQASSVSGTGFTTITAAGGGNSSGYSSGAGGALPTTGDINLAGQDGGISSSGGSGLYARGGGIGMAGLFGGGGGAGTSDVPSPQGSPGFVTIYWYA
jgi:hypothetical protein